MPLIVQSGFVCTAIATVLLKYYKSWVWKIRLWMCLLKWDCMGFFHITFERWEVIEDQTDEAVSKRPLGVYSLVQTNHSSLIKINLGIWHVRLIWGIGNHISFTIICYEPVIVTVQKICTILNQFCRQMSYKCQTELKQINIIAINTSQWLLWWGWQYLNTSQLSQVTSDFSFLMSGLILTTWLFVTLGCVGGNRSALMIFIASCTPSLNLQGSI